MANKEYLEMLSYGEWLEKYLDWELDKDIEIWRFKDLFEEAINILKLEGVGLQIVEDGVFKKLELLEELIKPKPDSRIDHSDHLSLSRLASSGYDPQLAEMQIDIDRIEAKKAESEFKIAELEKIIEFLSVRKKLINLSKALLKENRPWERVFSSNLTNKNYPIEFLLENYNGLVEKYHLENNKFKKKTELLPTTPTFMWMTIISRLFIGFLISDGQEYFGFCKHCDKFYLVQRKGKKKYCSDSCRALAHKEKKSN